MRLIVSVLLVLLSTQTQADFQFYGEARLGAGGVRHSELDFYPGFGSFSAGVFVVENIGIEGFIDVPLSVDENDIFELGISQASGVAVRLQSPPQRGLQAYVLMGYVEYQLNQEESGLFGERFIRQTFEGIRFSVGVNQHLEIMPGLIFGVEYRNFYSDSGITVDGVSAGLRFEMQ